MQKFDQGFLVDEQAFARGVMAARAGLVAAAATHLERAAERLPDDPNVWLWLAWVANSPDNAIRCLQRVLELAPGHVGAMAGLQWLRVLASDESLTPVSEHAVTATNDSAPASAELSEPAAENNVNKDNKEQERAEEAETASVVDAAWPGLPLVAEPDSQSRSDGEIAEPQIARGVCNSEPASCPIAAVEEPSKIRADESRHVPRPPEPLYRRWTDVREPIPQSALNLSAEVPPPLPPEVQNHEASVSSSRSLSDDSVPPAGSHEIAATAREPQTEATATSELESLEHSFRPTNKPGHDNQPPLVMVVDDSPTVRKLVSLTLERRGYRVVSAFDGVAAIKELGSCRPDLILLDINMPRLDGYRLCKLIKKHEATQNIPVVMLSGKDGMFDKLRGRLVGCSDYITKPFEADALTHKVAKYLAPTVASSL
jgi:twitching motility two-component system response regulator PilG